MILSLIAAIIAIVVNYFLAKEFYKAATAKGWNHKKYFWFSFLLPPAGYLLIIALPDRGGLHMSALVSNDLPEL